MALIKCKECGNEVSSEADKCPNCGVTVGSDIFGWVVLITLILVVLGMCVSYT